MDFKVNEYDNDNFSLSFDEDVEFRKILDKKNDISIFDKLKDNWTLNLLEIPENVLF